MHRGGSTSGSLPCLDGRATIHDDPTTMNEKYAVVTYGCQMNDHDSELMEGILQGRGMVRTSLEQDADVVVFNTCCVREGAESRAMARVQSLLGAKRNRPGMVIAVAGCVAQEKKGALLDALPHVDLVIGTRDYPRLGELIDAVRATGERFVATDAIDTPLSFEARPTRRSALRAHVNITYGCNNSCTFCIVPKTRGPEWSRPLAEIVSEVSALAASGTREVLLLGQNVNSYRDAEGRDFADLLLALDQVPGIWRIRYTSPNPKDARDRHISAIAQCRSVMEHLHLPVQSGSDRILRLMRRSYNTARYRQIAARLRAENPLSALTTDVIVGFPTETEEDFALTMDLFAEMRFDSAYMFHYSPRPGTVSAETLPDDVPHRVKLDRLRRLMELQDRISSELMQAEIGRTHEVLVEGPSRKGEGQLCGRTRTDKTVVFDGPERLAGTLASVRITEVRSHTLVGEVDTTEAVEAGEGVANQPRPAAVLS